MAALPSVNIDPERGASVLTDTGFYFAAVALLGGFVAAQFATEMGRQHVVDIQYPAADAVYALASAFVVATFLEGRNARFVALGCTASAIDTVVEELGLF